MQPTLEEKQHVLDLVQELKEYARDMPGLMKLPVEKRIKISERMIAIKDELKAFRERYPYA